jgi:signal transduction histidine kinase
MDGLLRLLDELLLKAERQTSKVESQLDQGTTFRVTFPA